MQIQKLITWLLILITAFSNKAFSQGDLRELSDQIGTTRNFVRINQIAKTYFDNEHSQTVNQTANPNIASHENEFENAELFYHRWAWFNGSHLDASGNITNYIQKNLEAIANEIPNGTNFQSSNSSWNLEGPKTYNPQHLMSDGQARVDCIAFHPTDPNTIYAGTPLGGLWKTTTGGSSWFQVTGLFPFLGINGIVVNNTNGNEVWVLAGTAENVNTWGIFALQNGCQVYHSTDGGNNWSATAPFPGIGPGQGYDLIQHPSSPNTLFAATTAGVWITTDGGNFWSLTSLNSDVTDIEINPISNRLFATGPGFVKFSPDNGATWSNSTFDVSIAGMNRASIAISPYLTGNTVYLLAGPAGVGTFYGVFKSTNGGVTFTRQSNSPNIFDTETNGLGKWDQSDYDNCIVAHPTDVSRILVAGSAIWQSVDNGVTMTFNTYYWNSASEPTRYVHPDVHAIKRNPLNNNLYACTDGGVWVSTDFGSNWSKNSSGLAAAQIFHFSTYKDNFYLEGFGSQDNGVKIRRTNGVYEQFDGGDGYAVQFSVNDSSIIYATVNDQFNKYGSFGITNLAINYPFVTATNKYYILPKVTPFTNGNEILFAACLDTLSHSTDGGASWIRVVKRSNWDITYAPSSPAYVYTAGGINYSSPAGFTLSRSTNYGLSNWTDISGTLGSYGQRAMKIVVDPLDPFKIYVCLGGYTAGQKIYKSTDGGTTWSTNISYNLPNVPVSSMAADKAGNLYAGTDIGVYVLPAGSAEWVAFYNNLPRVTITDLVVNETQQYIKASTFGTGIWKSNLYGGCAATTTVSFNQVGHQTFEASNFINANQVSMSGGYGFTDVRLRSGNLIIFTPGSNLSNGTLVASIGPCGVPFPAIHTTVNASTRQDSAQHPIKPKPSGKLQPVNSIR